MLPPSSLTPCASVLKPIYSWIAGPENASDANKAITLSDNAATDRLIDACGGLTKALQKINIKTGVELAPAETWGRILVDEETLYTMYESLVLSATTEVWASNILEAMKSVVPQQRLGVPEGLPMKAGWDVQGNSINTLLVVVTDVGPQVFIASQPISAEKKKQWHLDLENGGPTAVIGHHTPSVSQFTDSLRYGGGEGVPTSPAHDLLCPVHAGSCCPWMGDCDCQCACDFIHEVRTNERNRWNTGHWSEDWHRGYAQGKDDAYSAVAEDDSASDPKKPDSTQ